MCFIGKEIRAKSSQDGNLKKRLKVVIIAIKGPSAVVYTGSFISQAIISKLRRSLDTVDLEELPDSRERTCGNANTNVRKLHVSTMTSQHATRDPTTQQQGGHFGLVSSWRLDHTRGFRQDIHSTRVPGSPGTLWMARNHHND